VLSAKYCGGERSEGFWEIRISTNFTAQFYAFFTAVRRAAPRGLMRESQGSGTHMATKRLLMSGEIFQRSF